MHCSWCVLDCDEAQIRQLKRFKDHKIRASYFLQRLVTERADLFVHWKIGMTGTFT